MPGKELPEADTLAQSAGMHTVKQAMCTSRQSHCSTSTDQFGGRGHGNAAGREHTAIHVATRFSGLQSV